MEKKLINFHFALKGLLIAIKFKIFSPMTERYIKTLWFVVFIIFELIRTKFCFSLSP
jgi:hypothetical protein